MKFIKAYFAQLATENPARLVGTVVSVITAVSAFIVTLQPALSKVNGWGQAFIVIAAALIPFIQSHFTNKAFLSALSKKGIKGRFKANQHGSATVKALAVLGVLAVAFVIAVAVGASSSSSSLAAATNSSAAVSHQAVSSNDSALNDVSITKCSVDSTLGIPQAAVAVKNNSSKVSNYDVTVAFDAPDGSQFTTGTAFVQTLSPGQSGSAKAEGTEQDPPAGLTCKVTEALRLAS